MYKSKVILFERDLDTGHVVLIKIDKRATLEKMKSNLDTIVAKSPLLRDFHFEYTIVSIENPQPDSAYYTMSQADLQKVVADNQLAKNRRKK